MMAVDERREAKDALFDGFARIAAAFGNGRRGGISPYTKPGLSLKIPRLSHSMGADNDFQGVSAAGLGLNL
jgi:hypothetical protein